MIMLLRPFKLTAGRCIFHLEFSL